MEKRLRRLQQFLAGQTVRAKFDGRTNAGWSGKSLNVRLAVLRVKFV